MKQPREYALGRPVIITGSLNRFNGTQTYTLIFYRGLHNLARCSARMVCWYISILLFAILKENTSMISWKGS